jgi:hypothetical protein
MLYVAPEEPRNRLVDATYDIDDIKGSLARRARIRRVHIFLESHHRIRGITVKKALSKGSESSFRIRWHVFGPSPSYTRLVTTRLPILTILRKCCENVAKMLRKCCENVAKMLRTYCENIARILRKTILSEYCQNIAWLTHTARLLESPNHQWLRPGASVRCVTSMPCSNGRLGQNCITRNASHDLNAVQIGTYTYVLDAACIRCNGPGDDIVRSNSAGLLSRSSRVAAACKRSFINRK